MALPEEFLQELVMRSDISDIVSEYVNIKRRGRNMVGLCPFHSEKTPSFNVYTENNSFYCFGCGTGGNVINFVMRAENLDYIDAVKLLAQRAGMNMPEDTYDDSMSKLRKRIYEANRQAARFFYKQLYSPAGNRGLDYLRRRGLTDNTIRHFGLGFSPDNRFALCNHLKSLGFSNNEIVSANLAFQSKNGQAVYDRFVNRVMFPIIDLRGNVIAFGGRILTDQKPKYLNTSDTMVFKKSSNLFYLNEAKNNGDRKLILCEGYMDVIAVSQVGFKNAVATLGTALTSQQAILIKKYADEVIICYDSDEAGQKATARAINLLRNAGILIRILTLPNGKDPDEFIRSKGDNGYAAFKNILENSGNDVEYRLNKLKQQFNLQLSEGKVAYLTESVKTLASLDSLIEQDIYASKLSDEVSVQKESILEQIKKQSQKKKFNDNKQEFRKLQNQISGRDDKINRQKVKMPRGSKAEEALLAYLVNNPNKLEYIKSKLPKENFLTDFNRKLYDYFDNSISECLNPLNNIAYDFTADEASKIAEIISSYQIETATDQAMNEYINVIIEESSKPSQDDIKAASNDELRDFVNKIKNRQK